MLLHFALGLLFSHIKLFKCHIWVVLTSSLADFREMGVTYDGTKTYSMVSIFKSYVVMEMTTTSHAFKDAMAPC